MKEAFRIVDPSLGERNVRERALRSCPPPPPADVLRERSALFEERDATFDLAGLQRKCTEQRQRLACAFIVNETPVQHEAPFGAITRELDIAVLECADRQTVQEHGDPVLVLLLFVDGEALLAQPFCELEVAGEVRGARERSQSGRPQQGP